MANDLGVSVYLEGGGGPLSYPLHQLLGLQSGLIHPQTTLHPNLSLKFDDRSVFSWSYFVDEMNCILEDLLFNCRRSDIHSEGFLCLCELEFTHLWQMQLFLFVPLSYLCLQKLFQLWFLLDPYINCDGKSWGRRLFKSHPPLQRWFAPWLTYSQVDFKRWTAVVSQGKGCFYLLKMAGKLLVGWGVQKLLNKQVDLLPLLAFEPTFKIIQRVSGIAVEKFVYFERRNEQFGSNHLVDQRYDAMLDLLGIRRFVLFKIVFDYLIGCLIFLISLF